MKKLFLLFVFFFATALATPAKDFLYKIENINSDYVKETVNLYAENNNLTLKKNGNEYYLEGKKGHNWLISFTPSEENVEVYFYTPDKNSKAKKEIMKYFKRQNISFTRIKKSSELQKYRDLSGILFFQNFPSETTASTTKDNVQEEKKLTPEKAITENTPSDTTLPAGLKVNLSLTSAINSESLEKDDRISATVTDDVVSDDKILAEKGSIAYGTAIKSEEAKNGYKSGEIVIEFDKILTPQGKEIDMKSSQSVHKKTKAHEAAQKAGTIVTSVVFCVGMVALLGPVGVAGWIAAGVVGTVSGLGFGLEAIATTKGDEIELSEGETLHVVTL